MSKAEGVRLKAEMDPEEAMQEHGSLTASATMLVVLAWCWLTDRRRQLVGPRCRAAQTKLPNSQPSTPHPSTNL